MERTNSTNYFWSDTMPAHSHTYGQPNQTYSLFNANSNYPPYRGVKRWHRIA